MSVEILGEDMPCSPGEHQSPQLHLDTDNSEDEGVDAPSPSAVTTSAHNTTAAVPITLGATTIAPGYVVLVLLDGSTMCLDAASGEVKWALQGEGCGGPLVVKTEKFAKRSEPRATAERDEANHQGSSTSHDALIPATPAGARAHRIALVPDFVAGFGTSKDSIFSRKGGELTPADHFRMRPSFMVGDYFVTNSVDHVYLEIRLSDGDILCRGMDDQLTSTGGSMASPSVSTGGYQIPRSPLTPTSGRDFEGAAAHAVGPVVALLRTNKTTKGRKKNFVSWSFTTGDVNLSLLPGTSTPTTSSMSTGFGASGSPSRDRFVLPLPRVFVTGQVEVFTDRGEFLWDCDLSQEIVKAYHYCDACPMPKSHINSSSNTPTSHRPEGSSGGAFDAQSSSGPLRELKVSVCGNDDRRSAMLYNEATSFVFTKGEIPPVLTVAGLEEGGAQPVLLDATVGGGGSLLAITGGGVVQSLPTTTTGTTSGTPLSASTFLTSTPSAITHTASGTSHGSAKIETKGSPNEGNGGGGYFDGIDDTTVGSNSDEDFSEDDTDTQSQKTEVPASLMPAQSHFRNNFDVKGLLGEGADGLVMLCKEKITHLHYAVKVVPVRDQASEDVAFREVRLLARLQHPNIVRFFSVWTEEVAKEQHQQNHNAPRLLAPSAQDGFRRQALEAGNRHRQLTLGPGPTAGGGDILSGDTADQDDEDAEESYTTCNTEDLYGPVTKTMFIQMEYCHTTLAHFMAARKFISREDNLNVTAQLVDGLKYLHSEGVIHRDLKPANVLLVLSTGSSNTSDEMEEKKSRNSGDRTLTIKLGDFGLAKLPSASQAHEAHQDPEGVLSAFEVRQNSENHTQGVGTPLYSAPEQLNGKRCSPEGDIYSLGMLLLEMYILPQTSSERIYYMEKIRQGKGVDPKMLEQYPELKVALEMVHSDPAMRPSLKTLKALIKQQRKAPLVVG